MNKLDDTGAIDVLVCVCERAEAIEIFIRRACEIA